MPFWEIRGGSFAVRGNIRARAGELQLGSDGDAVLERKAANVMGPASGDYFRMTGATLALGTVAEGTAPTAAIGTAAGPGALSLRVHTGTAYLAAAIGGTLYQVAFGGTVAFG